MCDNNNVKEWLKEFIESQHDFDEDIAQIINDNWWEYLGDG